MLLPHIDQTAAAAAAAADNRRTGHTGGTAGIRHSPDRRLARAQKREHQERRRPRQAGSWQQQGGRQAPEPGCSS